MADDALPRIDTPPGRHLARGREATIHTLGPGRVLRRYDDGRDVTTELLLMRHVARHGVRVPGVHGIHVDGTGHRTGMVLEQLAGPTLAEAAVRGDVDPDGVGRTLARLHDGLHRVPLDGLPDLPRPPEPRPADVVVHLDLHPANVLLADGLPVLIDWSMARRGPASPDTAMTALTLGAAAVAGVPRDAGDVARLAVPRSLARAILAAYLAAGVESPAPSLERAAAVVDLVGAQPPDVVRSAVALVRSLGPDPVAR